jgi:hypothetical protein
MKVKKKHEEEGRSATPDKYKEFRLFLNSIESFNNIIDYLYFEHEDKVKYQNVDEFRKAMHAKYPELGELAELANAYKHCVRANRGRKNESLLWARDLQKPQLNIYVSLAGTEPLVDAQYEFQWPIEEHEAKLYKVFDFWLAYHRDLQAILCK